MVAVEKRLPLFLRAWGLRPSDGAGFPCARDAHAKIIGPSGSGQSQRPNRQEAQSVGLGIQQPLLPTLVLGESPLLWASVSSPGGRCGHKELNHVDFVGIKCNSV